MSGITYTAPMIYTSSTQVAAILPSPVPALDGLLTVTYNGIPTSPIPIHVVAGAFGIFTVTSSGSGAGVIQDANNHLLSFAQPAHPGDTVILWGTGLGPVPGDDASGPLPGNRFTPEVFVGTQAATVQYAGRSGCCAALDEIVFQVPQNIQGCFVPVAVRSSGIVSNFVSVPVGAAGAGCLDRIGLSPALLTKAITGTKLGIVALGPIPVLQNAGLNFTDALAERLSAMLGAKVSEQDLRTFTHRRGRAWKEAMRKYGPLLRAKHIDPAAITGMVTALNYQGAAASFVQYTGPAAFSSQFASTLPPPGTCTAGYMFPARNPAATEHSADAGQQLTLTGPAGTLILSRTFNGQYQIPLPRGSTAPGLPIGTYTISSAGGRDVGPFTANLDVGPALTWSNKASVPFIDRSQPLTITWSGGPSSGYVVFGGVANGGGAEPAFLCVEDVRMQTLTIPDFVLSALPHTSNGSVFLTAHPLQTMFSAPGIDFALFANLSSDSKEIALQ